MFGAVRIKKGYKETQLTKIFKQYGVKKFYDNVVVPNRSNNDPVSTFVTIVRHYLEAWAEESNVSFQNPASDTITKISGLRYLFYIFPEVCQRILNKSEKLTKDNFKKIIEQFPVALDLENVKCVFCDDKSTTTDEMEERSLSFRGEGATIGLAKKDIAKVIAHDNTVQSTSLI